MLEDTETPVLKKRLIWSIVFLVVLMYFSMGHMMWGWPVPDAMADNHVAMGLLQLLLTAAVMVINQKLLDSGLRIQHLCAVCHDGRAGAGRYGRRDAVHARVLF